MGCCQGNDCDCYENGYEDGIVHANNNIDGFDCAIDQSIVNFNEVKVLPISGGYVARIHINIPQGYGKTEKEAIGDLVQKLIECKLTVVAMSRNRSSWCNR